MLKVPITVEQTVRFVRSVRVCIYTYIHISFYMYIYIYINTYMCIQISIYIYTCIYILQ